MEPLLTDLAESLGADYRVDRELEGGGMSRVFLAEQISFQRRVVVKVFSAGVAEGVSVDRFKREIMVAAQLQHPHIIGVITAGEVAGLPYFVMPYVEGESLRDRLGAVGRLPMPEVVSILRDVARACSYAHANGIVHRDIKPDNVLLTAGSATLADFGVAKAIGDARQAESEGAGLTGIGISLGTPSYIAPEQAAADAATDHRADIYSLGVTAYEMLVGETPFHGRSPQKQLVAHITEQPRDVRERRDDVPEHLADLVMRCLAKDPADRPQQADEIVTALSGGTGPLVAVPGGLKKGRVHLVAIGAAVVTVGVALSWMVWDRAGPAGPPEPNSIAVLPLANVGGGADDEYFADGMTVELTDALNTVAGLQVASRTAAFRFKGTTEPLTDVARRLGVATLLEGTVRRSGDRLRLTAQLVDAADGLTLWSQTYERRMTDVFSVQDDISAAIVAALRDRFSGAPAVPQLRRGTSDLAAYDLYLRGRYLFDRRGRDNLLRALGFFREAVALDTNYAEAHAGIADVYGVLPLYSRARPDSVFPLALTAVDRAIELDTTLAAAYASRGSILTSSWRWREGEAALRRAVALDPRYATAHQWLGENLQAQGQLGEAVAELARAMELDPLSPVIAGVYAVALAARGDTTAAIETGRRAIELDPGFAAARMFLGSVLLYVGSPADALREFAVANTAVDGLAITAGLLGYAAAVLGDTARANVMLAELLSRSGEPNVETAIAKVYLGLGDRPAALDWLELAVSRHDAYLTAEPLTAPIYDAVREEPRFRRILQDLGLDPAASGRQ